jgi:uncharacterized membrane protein
MLWELLGIGALVAIMGMAQLYIFARHNVHGKVDWDAPVRDTVGQLLYSGSVGVALLILGIVLVVLGFPR